MMRTTEKDVPDFIGYDYKEAAVPTALTALYADCYENFGWTTIAAQTLPGGQTVLKLKRNRKISNKMELTRLQQNFESCANELIRLQRAKTDSAKTQALTVGLVGTAFMAGSTFAVTNTPPVIWLCVLLAIPGFLGWILPCFLYRYIAEKQSKKMQPLIEVKQDEIYELCKKGYTLL